MAKNPIPHNPFNEPPRGNWVGVLLALGPFLVFIAIVIAFGW
jgi:hypothetical protein